MMLKKLNALLNSAITKTENSATASYDDMLEVIASVDGASKSIHFTMEQARRKAAEWSQRADIVSFSFPHNISGYIVEKGNVANFSISQAEHSIQLDGCTALGVETRLNDYDLSDAFVKLFCFACDKDGRVLHKEKIDYNDGYGKDVIKIPAAAEKMYFAFRLGGKGKFGSITMDLTRIQKNQNNIKKPATQPAIAEKAKEPEKIAEPAEPPSAEFIEADGEYNARNYRRAIAILSGIEKRKDRERNLLLKCYTTLQYFDKAIAEYQLISSKGQTNATARMHYLRALANTGDTATSESLITSAVMSFENEKTTIDFLLNAYPFAAYISDTLAHVVRARILASLHLVKKARLNQVLRCAHDLIEEQRFEEFYRMLGVVSDMSLPVEDEAKVDILKAHAYFKLGRHDLKLTALNQAITRFGAKPIAVEDVGQPLGYETVHSPKCIKGSVHGPLVTVLMTTYNSAQTVSYALQSVLNQTYANLEILVMDDVSQDDTRAVVTAMAEKDSRIRVIPMSKNGGTYMAKNHGLHEAMGVFITCHDSDDWAHPEKIQRMVETLQAEPTLMATAIRHVRYDAKRGFRGRNGYIQLDAPSLLYRRKEVLDAVGYYDSVRAGADTEHQQRIERAFGKDSVKILPDLLCLFLWSESSLTGGGTFAIDDDVGIFSKPRSGYRQAHLIWQEHAERLFIDFPQNERLFEVPDAMKP